MTPHRLGLLLAAGLTMLSGCTDMLRTDSANFAIKSDQNRQRALASNRLASQQAAPAKLLAGADLARTLAGKSHVSEFRKASSDTRPYYAEYVYFSPDGRYLWLNTYEQRDPKTTAWGTWRVDGEVLCVTQQRNVSTPSCYTLRQEAGGALQYWTHNPDDAFHGLLTARVTIVREGPQTPAFDTASMPTR
jgi:hypothetical protein